MPYISDLHVHSCYSRATSKDLNLESLYQWAKIKGINVVGTGDFTHPEWFAELKEKLQPDGHGFFILKDPPDDAGIPGVRTRDIDVRFCLTSEISSIYKHGDRVRKNHNLVYAPDLETVARINHKLSSIGNLEADGRPILGLPSRDLLEVVLDTSDRAHLVPAHIWTPWFSTLGSKAGYDSIDACFRDLTDHLFAVETGLSSDPAMNWKLSALDRFTLISNSDAHSPSKLGREANLLDTERSYDAMFRAFKTGEGFLGTYEFYPEEGKYHHDGHRKCDISMPPGEARRHHNRCPHCGKPLTVGVLHRVEALADRMKSAQPEGAAGYRYIIPLPEVLGEIADVGANTQTVQTKYRRIISTFGNEFSLLHDVPIDDIRQQSGPVLAEAVKRIRQNEVQPRAGYDGVYGVIRVFGPGEIDRIRGQLGFFTERKPANHSAKKAAEPDFPCQQQDREPSSGATGLNAGQQLVAEAIRGAVLVKAGPGTGKTHTLIEWLARQTERKKFDASEITAVTFTNKAADEIRRRLRHRVGPEAGRVSLGTFHALCWQWLREKFDHLSTVYDPSNRKVMLQIIFPELTTTDRKALHEQTGSFLELENTRESSYSSQIRMYREHLWQQGAVDISDLIRRTVETLRDDSCWLSGLRRRCRVMAVDEFQDINPLQYELVKLLGRGQNLLAIGDADQAIYGFRGADVSLFFDFTGDFKAKEVVLRQNYRSTDRILKAATSLIRNNRQHRETELIARSKSKTPITIFEAKNPFREADYILGEIKRYVGGVESLTTGRHTDSAHSYGFGDMAVLFRTNAIGEALFKKFLKAGIPVHFGDGTAFLSEPPFTIVADMLRLVRHPEDRVLLSALLKDGYGWSSPQVTSLLQALKEKHRTLFGQSQPVSSLGRSFQEDLADLRNVYRTVSERTKSQEIAEAATYICDHFIDNNQLTESQQLKKEALLELAAEAEGQLEYFLEQLQLNPYTDAGRLKKQAVHLLTFHAAKGLEFPVVFIAAAEDGITPLIRKDADTDIDEERRLFYVAMTRAKKKLQVTCSGERSYYGEQQVMKPSRFIGEIPGNIKHKRKEGISSPGEPNRLESDQLNLF
ncbi:TIGR00375 family protein [Fodinibius roseus]|uniref:DNA 3'-5' helicase n=1 Tax=Fodinibius roseus TaxID=1194090 RepID=A0A1M4VQX7_9BACT|nr:UvrD-helicase domain-containing protein [Fodinibius roseus]SHE71328.1 TIGR00375 family protein [Fodinibius roseus]